MIAAKRARLSMAAKRARLLIDCDAGVDDAQALVAVKVRVVSVLQLQKMIAEGEARLKQQQNLYEAVRSDRNLYAKNLIESQDEIAEMKRKRRKRLEEKHEQQLAQENHDASRKVQMITRQASMANHVAEERIIVKHALSGASRWAAAAACRSARRRRPRSRATSAGSARSCARTASRTRRGA